MFRVTNYLKLTVENGIRIHKRQNPLRNGNPVDENGKKWASTMCFAWFVFEHGYKGKPTIEWIK